MKPEHVLIIDDDPDILQVMKGNLELEGYNVTCCQDGKTAMDIASRESPDIIILDLILPDMDGLQVCKMLRKQTQAPIIMLTARDGTANKVLGLEIGADDYIVKPVDILELIARVKACLRRNKQKLQEPLETGEIFINFMSREVRVRNKPVELTPKEYDLLNLLVTNAGRVLSRSEIRKEIWEKDDIYDWSRVIDVHIQHLRRKIEIDPNSPRYIITVPGVGYIFKLEKTQ